MPKLKNIPKIDIEEYRAQNLYLALPEKIRKDLCYPFYVMHTVNHFLSAEEKVAFLKYSVCIDEVLDVFVDTYKSVGSLNLSFDNNVLLKIAIVNNSHNVLWYLLQNGVEATAENNIAIRLAIHPRIIEELLKHGADATADDNYPICHLAQDDKCCVKSIQMLIEHGADIHARNEYPLRAASYRRDYELMEYLIKNGANVHADNDFCLRATSIDRRCFTMLMDAGANISALSAKDISKFLRKRDFDGIELLIEHGADLSVLNNHDFEEKCWTTGPDVVNLMIDQGVNAKQIAIVMAMDLKN